MSSTSRAEITASTGRLAKSAIFSRISRESASSERHTTMSGWIPIRRSSFTECCVGFVFSSPGVPDEGHEREVHEDAPVPAELGLQLADRLQERQGLDVADGPADLGDHEVEVLRLGDQLHALLDLVGDVRDHLHRAAEEVPAALLADHRVVDAAGRHVRGPGRVLVREALVVAEVEVRLGAVLGDEHLAVLERAHRAGVDVDVRVELLDLDPLAAAHQQAADRGRRDALPERRDHAAGDEDVARRSDVGAVGHQVDRTVPACSDGWLK